MRQRRDDPIGIARWSIWVVPRPVLFTIAVVELLAVGAVLADLRAGLPPLAAHLVALLVLAGAGIVSVEASLGVERSRRTADGMPHIDLSSVWTFAAAALLPGPMAVAVVLVIYGYLYLRVWRSIGVPPHRAVFSTATVVLAVQAAGAVIGLVGGPYPFHSLAGLAALLGGLITYAAVNMSLVATAIALNRPQRNPAAFRQAFGRADDAVLELATLSMGALTAGAMATFGPGYAVLVLPPLIILHRAVLVRQLEEEAATDGKTGLLNAAAWGVEADRAVRRIERLAGHATVLLLDLDNFKQVNDEHGHLVGDQVLVAVAAAIRDQVRDGDLVGRFGGEEFVVLLVAADGDPGRAGAETVANRIREHIEQLRIPVPTAAGEVQVGELTVSIGGATSPGDGTRLADLLAGADTAMYAAKQAGRNRVVMNPPAVGPALDAERSRSGNDSRAAGH